MYRCVGPSMSGTRPPHPTHLTVMVPCLATGGRAASWEPFEVGRHSSARALPRGGRLSHIRDGLRHDGGGPRQRPRPIRHAAPMEDDGPDRLLLVRRGGAAARRLRGPRALAARGRAGGAPSVPVRALRPGRAPGSEHAPVDPLHPAPDSPSHGYRSPRVACPGPRAAPAVGNPALRRAPSPGALTTLWSPGHSGTFPALRALG